MQGRDLLHAATVSVKVDVVADAIRRPEADDGIRH